MAKIKYSNEQFTKKIRELIDNDASLDVKIGSEDEELNDVSFITKKINIGNGSEGTITLVGPRRMDYGKIVNALEYLAEKIDEIYGGNDDEGKDVN